MTEVSAESRVWRREMFIAVLLGLATVGSSTSAYLAAWWGSAEALRFGEANAVRAESLRASNRATTEAQVDVTAFVAWLAAHGQGQERLAKYLERRFRPELRSAFEAWRDGSQVTEDGGVRSPPGTPFGLPDYRLASQEEAERLARRAEELIEEARRANTISTDYVLPTVLFSTVLFLAGIAIKLKSDAARFQVLLVATALIVLATVAIFVIPYLA